MNTNDVLVVYKGEIRHQRRRTCKIPLRGGGVGGRVLKKAIEKSATKDAEIVEYRCGVGGGWGC